MNGQTILLALLIIGQVILFLPMIIEFIVDDLEWNKLWIIPLSLPAFTPYAVFVYLIMGLSVLAVIAICDLFLSFVESIKKLVG